MGRSNFTVCGHRYMSDPELIARYNYTGPVKLIRPNPRTQITYEGCASLCGHGNEWYPWPTIAATITTWVLPIIGVLLQAPFESNAFWRTVKAINRWMGSPMASLTAILGDIAISSKCALFVDMALRYEDPIPDEFSDFADIRDSFYVLMNLNQYKMKRVISMTREAEGLLRIMLFSKDLKLIGTSKTLSQMRRRLAYDLRCNRRRGVVPVFISTLWFLVSLAISIEASFADVGSNAQADFLAMGLFVCWFPVLILCSILDRNPVASYDIQRKLNKMVDLVCESLQDDKTRADYIMSFSHLPHAQQMAYWTNKVTEKARYIKGEYFFGFAGQGRTRFHYGATFAILMDIEKSYIAEYGRDWLRDPDVARAALVLGQIDNGKTWFDGRKTWHVASSIVLVGGTGIGAFILSFFTPTVGLGCRSGGYLIFFVVAFVLLFAELFAWWFTSPLRKNDEFHEHIQKLTQCNSGSTAGRHRQLSFTGLAASKAALAKALRAAEEIIIWLSLLWIRVLPLKRKKMKLKSTEQAIRDHFTMLHNLTMRNWLQRLFFTPMEFANMIWLCYMLVAQTIGAFTNCACMTSGWGGIGGYVDFTLWTETDSPLVERYWLIGTVISCTIMGLGMGYIVLEWLLQAHLSTENYRDAAVGLKRVRRFRTFAHCIPFPSTLLVMLINSVLCACGLRESSSRKVLEWTKETKHRPPARDDNSRCGPFTVVSVLGEPCVNDEEKQLSRLKLVSSERIQWKVQGKR